MSEIAIPRKSMPQAVAPGPSLWEMIRYSRGVRVNYLDAIGGLTRFGDIARVSFPRIVHFIFHPDYVKQVLKDNHKSYRKSDFLKELEPVLGQGLLNSEGELWRQQRKLIAPEFQFQNIQKFSKNISQACENLMRSWTQTVSQNEPRNISTDMMALTLRIAGEVFFGSEVEESQEIGNALSTTQDHSIRRMVALFKLPLYVPTPSNLKTRKAMQTLDRVVFGIIEKRRREMNAHEDVLSRLLRATDDESGRKMDAKLLRDEVMTLLLAGHDTTSNSLSWSWFLIQKHPEIEKTWHTELESVLQGNPPTFDDLVRLPYTKMIFQEAMRLYPPAAVISRNALEEDVIGGYTIPKDSIVECSPWVTHRHPEFWKEPERFDPERFRPERISGQHPFAYFPFGGGPRECIGKNFAMAEGPLILAALGQRFQMRLVPGHVVEPQPLITVRPKHGIVVKLEKRV